jgi:hypothetical protein
MKNNIYVQYGGKEILIEDIMKKLKSAWTDKGNKVKDIKETNIYYKIEDNTAYCVVNKTETIAVPL